MLYYKNLNMEFLPDELIHTIKEFTVFTPNTKEELKIAIKLWCDNKV